MSIDLKSYALRILARREHSVYELKNKLLTKFPDQKKEIGNLIEEFIANDWVSDARFCEAFIRDQILKKNGPQKIKMKLREKGIDAELADEKMKQIYTEEQQKETKSYLRTKKCEEIRKKKPNISDYELNGKVYQYLKGKGF